jgi:hypothetical protein
MESGGRNGGGGLTENGGKGGRRLGIGGIELELKG